MELFLSHRRCIWRIDSVCAGGGQGNWCSRFPRNSSLHTSCKAMANGHNQSSTPRKGISFCQLGPCTTPRLASHQGSPCRARTRRPLKRSLSPWRCWPPRCCEVSRRLERSHTETNANRRRYGTRQSGTPARVGRRAAGIGVPVATPPATPPCVVWGSGSSHTVVLELFELGDRPPQGSVTCSLSFDNT